MTYQEIIIQHEVITENLSDFFRKLSQEQFTENINDGWSPAEHLTHLILDQKILAKALGLPKAALGLRFGKLDKKRQTYSYKSIVSQYQSALNTGFKAPQEFVPKQDKVVFDITQAVQDLQEASERLNRSLAKWDDVNLDNYTLPHPAFEQKLSIREILSFDLYHSLHHRNNLAKDLGFAESWPI